MEMLSAQYVFDETAKHLFSQGKPATLDGSCMYRTPDGLKCAAGFWIKDDEYTPAMENIWCVKVAREFGVFQGINIDLLRRLQNVHDTYQEANAWGSTKTMREELSAVAEAHELSTETLNTLSFADR